MSIIFKCDLCKAQTPHNFNDPFLNRKGIYMSASNNKNEPWFDLCEDCHILLSKAPLVKWIHILRERIK